MENQKENTAEKPAGASRKEHPRLAAALISVGCVIAALGMFLLIWYWGDKYPDFDRRFTEEAAIPGLDEGLVPQGIANYGDAMFVSGYMNEGGPSRIYYLDDGEEVGYVTLELADGSDYTGHACGIATNGSRFWVVSEGTVYMVNYADVTAAAATSGSVKVNYTWNPHNNADFCYFDGTFFYVGEFYRAGNYETDEGHRFTTPAGDENRAVIYRYGTGNYSGDEATPSRAYSITGEIQGMAICNDGERFVLSQSWGLKNSHLLVYRPDTDGYTYDAFKVNGSSIRTYYLDSSTLVDDYELPAMSEGLCNTGDKVYVLFESGSKKYGAFVRESLENIYSFRLRR